MMTSKDLIEKKAPLAYPAFMPDQSEHARQMWEDIQALDLPGLCPDLTRVLEPFRKIKHNTGVVMVFPHDYGPENKLRNFKSHNQPVNRDTWDEQGVVCLTHPMAQITGSTIDFRAIFEGIMGLQLAALLQRKCLVVICSQRNWPLADTLPKKGVILTFDPVNGTPGLGAPCPLKAVNRKRREQGLQKIEW